MRDITLGQSIDIDGNPYTVAAVDRSSVRLRNSSTGAALGMTLGEVARYIPREAVSAGSRPSLSPRAIEQLTDAQHAAVVTLAGHLEEIITGTHPTRRGESLPEYELTHSREDRINQKVADLCRVGIKTSRATLYRKLAEYEAAGAAGLIDKRWLRQGRTIAGIDPVLKDAFFRIATERRNDSTLTKLQFIKLVETEVLRSTAGQGYEMPSRASMYRYLDALLPSSLNTSAKSHRTNTNRRDGKQGKTNQQLAGAQVQIDSTELDVQVRYGEKLYRPILTIAVDVATRSIIAHTLRLKAAKTVDHLVLLAFMLTTDENMPDRSRFRAEVQTHMPRGLRLLDDDTLAEPQNRRPWVFPRQITTDNGMDFIGSAFQAACQKYLIDVNIAAPMTPMDKQIVERTFGTINTRFLQTISTYTGGSVERRGTDLDKKPEILHFYAFQELLDDWIRSVYQNTPHEGLRDEFDTETILTPNQKLWALNEVTASIRIPFTQEEFIDLLPINYRTIGTRGIKLSNREYDSHALDPIRGTKSGDKAHNGQWQVKANPYNPFLVWVVGPDGELIECVDREWESGLDPFADTTARAERDIVAGLGAAMVGLTGFAPPPRKAILPSTPAPTDTEITTDAADDELVIGTFDEQD